MKEHSARAIGALVVLLILIALFWQKIKAMLAPAGTVSTAVGGNTVPASAKVMSPAAIAAFTPVPTYAVPESAPLGQGAPTVSGSMSTSDVAAYTPFPFQNTETLSNAGLSAQDLQAIQDASFQE